MNNLATTSLAPTNMADALKFSEMLASSTMVPNTFKNRPGDILAAMQMGYEVGFQPLQALHSIAVINGRPCLWGDGLLALAQAHPHFEYIEEEVENDVASCTVKRKNSPAHTVTFSKDDAIKAGLWNKKGPWQTYPNRMLQMRARGFALRNQFADALAGFMPAEEVSDYPVKTMPPQPALKNVTPEGPQPAIQAEITPIPTTKNLIIELKKKLVEKNGVESAKNIYTQMLKNSEVSEETVSVQMLEEWLKNLQTNEGVSHDI